MRDEFELCASTGFSPAQRDSREAASESSSPAQHLSQDPGVPGPQPEPLAAESSSHSYEPLTPQAVSDSISNFEAETQSEAPDKTDRQSWKSSWAQHGWLSQNPLVRGCQSRCLKREGQLCAQVMPAQHNKAAAALQIDILSSFPAWCRAFPPRWRCTRCSLASQSTGYFSRILDSTSSTADRLDEGVYNLLQGELWIHSTA